MEVEATLFSSTYSQMRTLCLLPDNLPIYSSEFYCDSTKPKKNNYLAQEFMNFFFYPRKFRFTVASLKRHPPVRVGSPNFMQREIPSSRCRIRNCAICCGILCNIKNRRTGPLAKLFLFTQSHGSTTLTFSLCGFSLFILTIDNFGPIS